MSDTRKILSNAYNLAGRDFLSYRLTRVFGRIEGQEDIALHNDVMAEVDVMLAEHAPEAMLEIADVILKYSGKGQK
jgi:hypothetical protein